MHGGFLLLLCMLLFPALGFSAAACLTTLPPDPPFTPPAPYDSKPGGGGFWYGADALWTQLDLDGVWHIHGNVDKTEGYVTKLIFWRRGFDWRKEPEPKIILTARRLDGDSPSVAVAGASAVFITGIPAMMTGIRIPNAGCWEVSAYYRGHRLTFVVSIEP